MREKPRDSPTRERSPLHSFRVGSDDICSAAKASARRTRWISIEYEFLVYRLLRNALEAGDVYVQDSSGFRRFEDNLIEDARWENKDALLHEIDAALLLAPIEQTLAGLRDEIDARFDSVNKRIEDGGNKHIKVTGVGDKRRWTLIYPTDDEPVNSPFYSQLPGIDIEELLWFVAECQLR